MLEFSQNSDQSKPLKVTLEMYYKMAEMGILEASKRYELLEGVIFELIPISPRHATKVKKLEGQLETCLGNKAVVLTQHPLQMPDTSEPQPDILVVKPPLERYEERHPLPEDILLIIEISDSTLRKDRTEKLMLYASVGIPEYWILNLKKMWLEVNRVPDSAEGRYRETKVLTLNEAASFGGCEVAWWL
jgi:Uma2 family endonuclease